MVSEFKSYLHLMDYFKDNSTCVAYLALQRWDNTPSCPHCGNVGAYVTNRGFKCKAKECAKKFTVTTGTIFEGSKIPLRSWFAAIYLASNHKKGISSLQLSRDLGITQKSAWFMLHRIREMLTNNAPELLTGVIEADATYIGGNITKMHKKRRDKLNAIGTGSSTKVGVFGMVQRDGNIITQVIPKETQQVIHPIIKQFVAPDSLLVTDGHSAYLGMKEFGHEALSHEKGEYVRDHLHTGFIDGFWSQLKRGINGIYHQVSPKHLHRYCHEFGYKYNTRQLTDCNRFDRVIKLADNKRLTYANLIA